MYGSANANGHAVSRARDCEFVLTRIYYDSRRFIPVIFPPRRSVLSTYKRHERRKSRFPPRRMLTLHFAPCNLLINVKSTIFSFLRQMRCSNDLNYFSQKSKIEFHEMIFFTKLR